MVVLVKKGRSMPGKYSRRLKRLGLRFENGTWSAKSPPNWRRIRRFCERHGLTYVETKSQYVRSGSYRGVFFTHEKGDRGNGKVYHCAYCGRRLKRDDVTVDHVIPVSSAQKTRSGRAAMAFWGITNVNDPANLVAACEKCNSRKADRSGLWVIRGFLGRSIWFWRLLRLAIAAAAAVLAYYLICRHTGLGSPGEVLRFIAEKVLGLYAGIREVLLSEGIDERFLELSTKNE